jgi:lysine 2,3-aminomutase
MSFNEETEQYIAHKENIFDFDPKTPHSTPIDHRSRQTVERLLDETPRLKYMIENLETFDDFLEELRDWAQSIMIEDQDAYAYFKGKLSGYETMRRLSWKDYAAIRILDYIDNTGLEIRDIDLIGTKFINNPFKSLWLAAREGTSGAHLNYFTDMLFLFRQLTGKLERKAPDKAKLLDWMDRHPSGLDDEVMWLRKQNKERIMKVLIRKMDEGTIKDNRFEFKEGMSQDDKLKTMRKWWTERLFHLRFAIRETDLLNELLDNSLDEKTVTILKKAEEAGIPIFVNPYYLSLILVNPPDEYKGTDMPIRDYVFTSKELVHEFGRIVAWEKEDKVEPGKPNAAGWLLPSHSNVHRRYPEVAILIPDTVGRACGGLCVSCQRMYDFQSGNLNFNLEKLRPQGSWWDRLPELMEYYENDSQLRDILITGGDSLMSSDNSLKRILDAVYETALRKKKANESRPDGKKYAEILRVRLGTRLPVYLPQRITPELLKILKDFRLKAIEIGLKQFVIQTHFETAMEVTEEVKEGIDKLLSTGWIVTNQQVFTTAASRRGHTAKLRKVLNDIGVLPYYTFTVKGYMENYHNFATNARAIQEQYEEKRYGNVPDEYIEDIKDLPSMASDVVKSLKKLRKKTGMPFLATDRNMLNLPGIGKSLNFRVIGITRFGRRILEFDHDHTRVHSPIIDRMGKVTIVESKPIRELMKQYAAMGEDIRDYVSVYGYSIGENEVRMPIYKYPEYPFGITSKLTNLEIDD